MDYIRKHCLENKIAKTIKKGVCENIVFNFYKYTL